jgi:hypothetical protein
VGIEAPATKATAPFLREKTDLEGLSALENRRVAAHVIIPPGSALCKSDYTLLSDSQFGTRPLGFCSLEQQVGARIVCSSLAALARTTETLKVSALAETGAI